LNFSLESFEKTVRYLQTKIIKEPIKHNDDSDLSSLCSSNENKDNGLKRKKNTNDEANESIQQTTNNNEHKIKISLRIETLNSIDLYNDKNSPPHIIVNKEKVKDRMKKQYVFQLSVLGEKRQWRSKFIDDENKYDSAQQKLDTI
jgi:hypothetical protein